MKRKGSLLLLWAISLNIQAQELATSNDRAFSFFYANDVSGMTDQYYTNGVRFDLTMPMFSKSPFNLKGLASKLNSATYHTLGLIYDVYTPNLNSDLFTDRPFSAVLMLVSRHQYVGAANKIRLTSEMRLGIIGPAAGAGRLQNGIHSVLPGADKVYGWDTQIQNDLAINYIFSAEKQVHRTDFSELIIASTAYIGSPVTKIEPEVLIRIGFMEDYFNVLNSNPKAKWQAFIYGDFKVAYVVYNATLQGGLLNPNSSYVIHHIEPVVLDFQVGLGINYKSYNLKLGQHLITPEFSGADLYQWGELTFAITF